MDRASDFESAGYRFEPCRAQDKKTSCASDWFRCLQPRFGGLEAPRYEHARHRACEAEPACRRDQPYEHRKTSPAGRKTERPAIVVGFVVLADSSINRPCWTDYQLIPKIFITTEIIIGFSSGFDSAMRSVIATRVPLLITGLPSARLRAPFF